MGCQGLAGGLQRAQWGEGGGTGRWGRALILRGAAPAARAGMGWQLCPMAQWSVHHPAMEGKGLEKKPKGCCMHPIPSARRRGPSSRLETSPLLAKIQLPELPSGHVRSSSLSHGSQKHPMPPQGSPVRTCFQQLGHSQHPATPPATFPAPHHPDLHHPTVGFKG